MKKLPSVEKLNELFLYCHTTGVVVRKKSVSSTAMVGDFPGTMQHGYCTVKIDNERFRLHRIIWKMVNGKDPVGTIDHISGDTTDNSITNLRDVTRAVNSQNQKMPNRNTSGFVGVHWHKFARKWVAEIRLNNKKIGLGYFADKYSAAEARKKAEKKYGFHENHGRKT